MIHGCWAHRSHRSHPRPPTTTAILPSLFSMFLINLERDSGGRFLAAHNKHLTSNANSLSIRIKAVSMHLPTSLGLGNQFYILMQFSLGGFVGENQRIEPGIMDFSHEFWRDSCKISQSTLVFCHFCPYKHRNHPAAIPTRLPRGHVETL